MSDFKVFHTREIHVADDDDLVVDGVLEDTFDERLAVVECRWTPAQMKAPDLSYQSRLWKSAAGFNLGRAGTLEIDFYAGGAGADTATGALPTPPHYKLLRDGLGGGDATQVGGVAGATATTTSMPNATGTRVHGAISRVGVAKDARARGQAVVWGNPTTGTLVAMAGAPAAGDVIRAGLMVYPTETPGPTKRFLVGWTKTGMAYIAHGCQLAAIRRSMPANGIPMITFVYGVQYWRPIVVTVPTAEVMVGLTPAPSNGGSYVLAPLGQTTRSLIKAPEIEITINLGLQPITGPGGIDMHHGVTDWVRVKGNRDEPAGMLRLTAHFDAQFGEDWDADAGDANEYHMLATHSPGEGGITEGRHIVDYWPLLRYMGERPSPFEWQGLTGTQLLFAMDEGPDETSELTRSFWRMALT